MDVDQKKGMKKGSPNAGPYKKEGRTYERWTVAMSLWKAGESDTAESRRSFFGEGLVVGRRKRRRGVNSVKGGGKKKANLHVINSMTHSGYATRSKANPAGKRDSNLVKESNTSDQGGSRGEKERRVLGH